MKITKIQASLVLLCFVACTNFEKYDESAEVIAIEKNSQIGSFPDFFELSQIIPLETNNENYIKQVEKIILNRLGIFIQDGLNRILVFDSGGNYIRQLNYLGKGPGEWTEIFDFEVNSQDSIIIIRSQFKELFFNINGDFIHEEFLEESAKSFLALNKSITILYLVSGDYNSDIIVQHEGKINKYLLKSNKAMTGYFFGRKYARNFCQTSFGVYFVRSFDNYIYQIDDLNYVMPRYRVDFGNNNYPIGKKLKPEKIQDLDKEYANYISSIYENTDYLYFESVLTD